MTVSSVSSSQQAYRPPAPVPKVMLSLAEGELLSMLPQGCYVHEFIHLRKGKRPIVLVNDPAMIRAILVEKPESFPKSDVMIAALEPLLGHGILISNGELWHRQRAMLEPSFAQMRVKAMFRHIERALAHCAESLSALGDGEIALESVLSALALEVICRSIFSDGLSDEDVRHVYAEFSLYQRLLPQAGPLALFGYRNNNAQPTEFLAACRSLRGLIEKLVNRRLADSSVLQSKADIMGSIMDARHPDGGQFSFREIVDQVMVFFLAGHETSASAMTWAIFILSQQPQLAERVRSESGALAPGRSLAYDQMGSLVLARSIFLETLRLYPPAAFLTRIASETAMFGEHVVEAGSLVVISPWIVHRHHLYWDAPDTFIPERFAKSSESDIRPGTFIPFGMGQRICTGRALAMVEVPFLIAELTRRFRFDVQNAGDIQPAGRLTIRPNVEIRSRVWTIN